MRIFYTQKNGLTYIHVHVHIHIVHSLSSLILYVFEDIFTCRPGVSKQVMCECTCLIIYTPRERLVSPLYMCTSPFPPSFLFPSPFLTPRLSSSPSSPSPPLLPPPHKRTISSTPCSSCGCWGHWMTLGG